MFRVLCGSLSAVSEMLGSFFIPPRAGLLCPNRILFPSAGPGLRCLQQETRGSDQISRPRGRREGKHHQLRGRGRRRGRYDSFRHHSSTDPHS